jgi:DNA-binding NarL/FixJ family response regulator
VAGRPDNDDRLVAGAIDASAPVPPRVRTLIVDDSETVRDGLSMLLEARPYCELVGAVAEPEEALEITQTMHPHVVLQDFSMPGVDPFGLMRALSACRPRPAVLVLSAFADAPSARQAAQAGAVGWVLKDAEPEELFAALRGAAGFRDTAVAVPGDTAGRPEPSELGSALDARTVWALLRALEGDPSGMTVEGLATRAVLPVAIAVRYVQRLTTRQPALVTAADAPSTPPAYLLTSAGRRELARLERRIPTARNGAGQHLLR